MEKTKKRFRDRKATLKSGICLISIRKGKTREHKGEALF